MAPAQAGPRTSGERTKQRILDAALPLFAEHGYAGTPVRKIAGAARVNVATLAYHYDGKDGLYDACIDHVYAQVSAVQVDLAGPDPVEALVRSSWRFAVGHRVGIRLLHRHLLDRGRHHDVLEQRWLEPLLAIVDPVLGALRPDWDATTRRLLVFSVMHLVVRFALDDPDQLRHSLDAPDPEDVLVRWLTSLVTSRLKADAPLASGAIRE